MLWKKFFSSTLIVSALNFDCCDRDTPSRLTGLCSRYRGVIVVEVVVEQMFLRLAERTTPLTFNTVGRKNSK